MDMAFPPRRGMLELADELRGRITDGTYPLNTRVPPERHLAAEFGVARGTVRAALAQLDRAGMVARRPGSGTYVIWSPDQRTPGVEITRPLELVDARTAIEPHMVRLAVRHAREADLRAAEAHLEAMEAGLDNRAFADEDERFHLALAAASRNPMIKWMMLKCHEVRSHAQWSRMRTLTLNPAIIARYNRQHRAIVDAIRARDAETASRTMQDHLETARWSLIEAIT